MMKIRESFRLSWRAITGHKLRSTLTTLGIVIGVASVIVFIIMGNGFMADALADIEEDRESTLSVQTQSSASTSLGWQLQTSPIYTESDIEQLRAIEDVEYVAPDGWLSGAQLANGEESITGNFNVRATIPEKLSHEGIVTGETLAGPDETVVNQETARAFAENVSVGDELVVTMEDGSKTRLTVAGVVDDGDSGWNAQPTVYVHVDHHYNLTVVTPDGTEERAYPFLELKTTSLDSREEVQTRAREYLKSESDASQLKENGHDIRVLTREDQIERFENVIDQITVFVTSIAAISLFVGSIGIANIMIVSVTERTREIGIMKAVGARKRDVIQLFLVEAVLLGTIGAIFGVLAGLGVGYLAVSLLGWPMAYPVAWIGLAVAIGIGVGIVSGLYPAWRAASVDPIEALRHE